MGENENRPSVLYIDSDEHLLNSAKEHLEDVFGIHVDTSPVFLEGIKKTGRHAYDAIVSEIEFTGTDVIGLMKEKRDNGLYTPFIATYSNRDILRNESDSAADFYLYKGGDMSLMYDELYRYIKESVELVKIRKRIFKSETIFPVIWDTSPDGILITAADNKTVIGANPAALKIFGVNKTVITKYPDLSSDPNISSLFVAAIENNISDVFEMEYDFDRSPLTDFYGSHREGKIFLEVRISPLIKDNRREGSVIYVTDITEKKKSGQAVSRANKKLSLLTGITRHDVLNQIMAVRLYTELIFDSSGDDEGICCYVEAINSCMEKIERQINSTRDYENLGRYMPVWQSLDKIIQMAAPSNQGKDIHIFTNLGSYEVYADQMLIMVFFNLFDNSARHGGDVTNIVLSFYDTGDEGVIVFEDNGVGISEEDKENIFKKGFGSNTGYGLFLIREILDFKGYRIRETGIPGEGARFEIHVPRDKWRLPKEQKKDI